MERCTLCGSKELTEIVPENDVRLYFHCNCCSLIFVHQDYHLSPEAEKAHYLKHVNDIDQPGYVNFLNRVIEPALSYILSSHIGLDYGCGPNPTLSKLVESKGVKCHNYDPFFFPERPAKEFDFIFSTECFEHFTLPDVEIPMVLSSLKSGGYLFLMTERWENIDAFEKWYYKIDPTHVSFFHLNTFNYLCEKFQLDEIYRDENRVIILRKALMN